MADGVIPDETTRTPGRPVADATGDATGTVHVRLFAGAADAVDADELTVSRIGTAGELVDRLCEGREERVRQVLDQCSFLIDGTRIPSPDAPIPPGATVDVLPPFAGG